MTKRLLVLAVLVALFAVPGTAAASASRPRTAVVLLAPYVSWEDVLSGYMPRLHAMAEDGATADMNVRSLLPGSGRPSADEGALMLSAGSWARFDADAPPPQPRPPLPGAVYPGLEDQVTANTAGDAVVLLGTLGAAVRDAGGVTAAIGNADGLQPSRPAALAAMDASGVVALGDISPALVVTASPQLAPFGKLSDRGAISAELDRALGQARLARGPALIVIDPGDLARARATSGEGQADDLGPVARVTALRQLDAVLGDIQSRLPGDALLVVAAPVAAHRGGAISGFGPLAIQGQGFSGRLVSPSTHRPGLVTIADLTATLLDQLGLRVPDNVGGAPLTSQPEDGHGDSELLYLQRLDAFMRASDGMRPVVVDGFILAVVLFAGLGVVALTLRPVPHLLAAVTEAALLAVVCVPAASVLMFAVVGMPQTPTGLLVLFGVAVFCLWTVAIVTHQRQGSPRAFAFVVLLTPIVILADQLFGAPLSLDGLFGYSPLVGARYFGMGNEMAALAVGGTLTGLALLFDYYTARPWVSRWRRWGFPLAGAAVLTACCAPFFGANIGVAVWGTVAFGVAWWGMLGRRFGWRSVLVLGLAVLLVVGIFVGLDTLTSPAGRTHVGRTVVSAQRTGVAPALALLTRKAATNVRTLLQTHWSWLFLGLVVALGFVRWRPRGVMLDTFVELPHFAAALSAALVAGIVAFFSEDSGIVVPALLLLFPGVGVVYLLLVRRSEADGR